MSDKMTGGCLCGLVRFEVSEVNLQAINCHCSICRRQSGAPLMSFVAAPLQGFAYTQGEENISYYATSRDFGRTFCKLCGAPLPIVDSQHHKIYIPAPDLDDQQGIRVDAHMFVASKAPWHRIGDEAQQYDEFPGH